MLITITFAVLINELHELFLIDVKIISLREITDYVPTNSFPLHRAGATVVPLKCQSFTPLA